jgi:ammonium transporter Rh
MSDSSSQQSSSEQSSSQSDSQSHSQSNSQSRSDSEQSSRSGSRSRSSSHAPPAHPHHDEHGISIRSKARSESASDVQNAVEMKPVHHTAHHHTDNGLSLRSQDPSSSSTSEEELKTPADNHRIAAHHTGANHVHTNGKADGHSTTHKSDGYTSDGAHAKYHDATPNPRADPFAIFAIIFQVAMILVYAFIVDYDAPQDGLLEPDGHNVMPRYYSLYTDIAVMMFIGFGYLMTFLKKYRYGAVGFTFFLVVFTIQWALLVVGFFEKAVEGHWDEKIHVNFFALINALFCSATILISLGGVIGKVSPFQLLWMAFFETILFGLNIYFQLYFGAVDIGGSMNIHTLGAYFGLTVTMIVSNKHSHHSANLGSSYSSNTFSMIGTIFLWILWPSFNAAIGTQLSQPRAIVNTVLSLCGSGLMATALSKLVRPERKFDMEDFENATLAGGVAIGSFADFRLNLGGALTVGTVAGTVSVLGFRYLGPFLRRKIGLKDTCGIHNLHGIPGLIGGVGSIIAARTATREAYGNEFNTIFPRGEDQWQAQIISLAITLGIAIVGGIVVGYFLKLLYRVTPNKKFFDDKEHFEVFWKEE